jgi:hypothetical protein
MLGIIKYETSQFDDFAQLYPLKIFKNDLIAFVEQSAH